MGNHIGVPTTADLEAMMATTNCECCTAHTHMHACTHGGGAAVTDVELRRLFGQLNVLTEEAVARADMQPTPPLPAHGPDDAGTDQRLVLQRIAQLLDPCKSEEDRFTVCAPSRPSSNSLSPARTLTTPHRSSWPRSRSSPPRATATASCAVCHALSHPPQHQHQHTTPHPVPRSCVQRV